MNTLHEIYVKTCHDRPFVSVLALCLLAAGVALAGPSVAEALASAVGAGYHGPAFLFADERALMVERFGAAATAIATLALLPWLHIGGQPWDYAARRLSNLALLVMGATIAGVQLL